MPGTQAVSETREASGSRELCVLAAKVLGSASEGDPLGCCVVFLKNADLQRRLNSRATPISVVALFLILNTASLWH